MRKFQYTALLKSKVFSHSLKKLLQEISIGLSFTHFEDLKTVFSINNDKRLCEIIGINPRTLSRRKQENRFNKEESDRILKIWRIFNLATEILGNQENAANWLQAPQFGLENLLPIDLLSTDLGSHEVEELLYQIKYGIFS